MSEIIEVKNKDQFDFLYDNWAMTWEGLIEDDFQTAIDAVGGDDAKGYHITGKDMNRFYKLTGDNAYPEDLSIFAVYPSKGLAIQWGARWFTDIVDNNKRREKEQRKRTS